MIKKISITFLLIALIITSFVFPVFGASGQVSVTIPAFPITLNGLDFSNNSNARYPLLVYKDITYFPMTFYQSNLLNLNTSWTAEDGLVIEKDNPEKPKEFVNEVPLGNQNSRMQIATIINSKVTVNGKMIDNSSEPYPLILFRDITYFPLTWKFAVDEFGWGYAFDNTTGLHIAADNYFYISGEGGSGYFDENDGFAISYAETHYIKGDLRISLITDSQRLVGAVFGNLRIVKAGVETRPDGYFGYAQRQKGPLFTVDGRAIHTTYYDGTPEYMNPQPARVNIDTGQVQR